MENVFDAGKVPYEAAPPLVPLTIREQLILFFSTFFDVIKVLVLSIPNWIDSFMHLFINRPKKCIAGQVAVITGSGNGIGRSIALRLATEGCKIAVVDIDADAAVKTAEDLKCLNVKAKAYNIDVADFESVQTLRKQIELDLGTVDILINNAGLIPFLSLREGTEREIQRIVEVNLTSNFYVTRTFLPGMMQRRKGHIISIASMTSLHPMPGAIIYSATKCGVQGFIDALSEELRQDGFGDCIHFTSVRPYFVSTRKDLMESLHIRFPAISAEETAEATVNGLLRNEKNITIPKIDSFLAGLIRVLPYKNQELVRDYVLHEKESQMFARKIISKPKI